MPAPVVVIVNALARRWREAPHLLGAARALVEGRAVLHVTRDLGELEAAARRSVDAEVVVLSGGDGTYGAGISALHRVLGRLPTVALAPGGTVGTIARSLGVDAGRDPIAGLSRMLHAAHARPRIKRTPTLAIEHDHGHALGFIVGSGLVASFFELYDQGAAAALASGAAEATGPSSGGGNLAAARIVARVFLESFVSGPLAERVLSPLACEVAVDGRVLAFPASSLIVASVLRDLGLGMLVTHRGGEDPTRPHVVVSGLLPRALGPRMFRVLRGVPIAGDDEAHFDGLVGALTVDFGAEGGPWVLDGDLRRSRKITVRAGPTVDLLDLHGRAPYPPD